MRRQIFKILHHFIRYNCVVISLLLLPLTATAAAPTRVLRVVDGDTILVLYQGKPEKIRFLRVNTPESVSPDKKQNVPMGKVASEYTKKRLAGRFVDLEFEGPFRGRYGRMLAYVYVNGVNFNLELVRKGLSPYYTKYGKSLRYDKEFKAAERTARDAHLGIWSTPESTRKYLKLKSEWGQKARAINQYQINKKVLVYHGNIKSKIFHRPGCRYFNCKNCKAIFHSRDAAIAAGYRPCKICKP